MVIEKHLKNYKQRINQFLHRCLSFSSTGSLYEAMRYSVLNGGKRLRPLLMYILGESLGLPIQELDWAACAVELIHAYSLIHDDLPLMDNDDWRRGQLSCHRRFGEAIALLAGDALQTLAFQVLLKSPVSPTTILTMINVLAKAAGPSGMIAGQAMELDSLSNPLHCEKRKTIYNLKTGALFAVSLELTGIVAGISSDALSSLVHLGYSIGLIYQLDDDISDNMIKSQDLTVTKDFFQKSFLASLQDLRQKLPVLFDNKHFLLQLSYLLSGQMTKISANNEKTLPS